MRTLQLSEILLLTAGVLLLVGVAVVAEGGSFTLWTAAKILYGIGALGFLYSA